jgi:hypothetical protein
MLASELAQKSNGFGGSASICSFQLQIIYISVFDWRTLRFAYTYNVLFFLFAGSEA